NYVGYIFNLRGKTYLTGSVSDPLDPGQTATFLRYNGAAWEHVPGWNTLSPIKEVLIRNDTLYVAGAFRQATGGPGNLIARFDGEHWDDMGGGLAYTPNPYAGAALDLEWWRGHLLVSGRFNTASDIECSGIIKWNGNQWCSFPGVIQTWSGIYSRIPEMAIWRDSLYICGNISTIDSDTVQQVAQWIGGDAVGYCSSPVGMAEAPFPSAALEADYLGAGQWSIRFPDA